MRGYVALVAILAVLAGCTGGPGKPSDVPTRGAGTTSAAPVSASPSPSPSPSAVAPTGTAEEQILAQYRKFWTEALPAAFAAPAAQRRSILAPVVMDPLLKRLLEDVSALDAKHQTSRGRPTLVKHVVTRTGASATVFGCLDFSKTAIVDRSTGRIVEPGNPRYPLRTRFARGSDHVWRAVALDETEGAKC